ncbi:methyl-CpG-binding domain-containing protein 7 isoform X1 [Jatropha curcas]|uniref:methyl-CpG-binding domain-containing protein 7 isoform X1 n=1 Tax=Jatropha curcas TaxID=180498 RepID=UPI0009D73DE3|nr:methyl-CpG-binding domain-containing protein 7 isoform X1 [Jatropha curcas]
MGREVSLSSLLILSGKQNQNRESEIVGPISTTSTAVCSSAPPFELPDGWVVEQRRRPRNGRFDKCYIEPGTGKRFRSLVSVQRYLTSDQLSLTDGKVYTTMAKEGNHTISLLQMQTVPHNYKSCSHFTLPDGWVVEEKPRSNGNYAGVVDRCYIEPGTGKRFRSLTSVERYLTEKKAYEAPNALNPGDQLYLTDGKEYTAMPEALELGDHTLSNHPNPEKKHVSGDEVDTSIVDLGNPPAKIKWVLSPVGNIWRSFSEDTLVPEAVKHKWSETFIRSLNDRY